MAEVIYSFESPLVLDNVVYRCHAAGRSHESGWQGWIEFRSAPGDDVRRTRLETTQPTRAALRAWAAGLNYAYLQDAIARAVEPLILRQRDDESRAFFSGPAPVSVVAASREVALDQHPALRLLI
jgi:hypothetical protein